MRRLTFIERLQVPTYDNPEHVAFGKVAIDTDKCSGCGLCIRICPADALIFEDKAPVMKAPGENECMACADCLAFCPEKAIRLVRELRCRKGRYRAVAQGPLSGPRL